MWGHHGVAQSPWMHRHLRWDRRIEMQGCRSQRKRLLNNKGPVRGGKQLGCHLWLLEYLVGLWRSPSPPIILQGRYLCNSFPHKPGKGLTSQDHQDQGRVCLPGNSSCKHFPVHQALPHTFHHFLLLAPIWQTHSLRLGEVARGPGSHSRGPPRATFPTPYPLQIQLTPFCLLSPGQLLPGRGGPGTPLG